MVVTAVGKVDELKNRLSQQRYDLIISDGSEITVDGRSLEDITLRGENHLYMWVEPEIKQSRQTRDMMNEDNPYNGKTPITFICRRPNNAPNDPNSYYSPVTYQFSPRKGRDVDYYDEKKNSVNYFDELHIKTLTKLEAAIKYFDTIFPNQQLQRS